MNNDQFKRFLTRTFRVLLLLIRPCEPRVKARIKTNILNAYAQKHQTVTNVWWAEWFESFRFSSPLFKMALSFGLFFFGFMIFPLFHSEILAGYISPKDGTVTLIRDNETLLIDQNTILQEGDIIHVGYNGEASIVFPNQFESLLKARTELQIINQDEIFIEKGVVINKSYENHQFSSDRGFVASTPGSAFTISISDSGEMEVIAEKNNIQVFDWKNGETFITPGEKISLRTDTLLTHKEIPKNISLSSLQLNSIQAKLIISRTKLLTTLEKLTRGEHDAAEKDFVSAQKTFFSILTILSSSRDLETKKQLHWEAFSFSDVIHELKNKSVPQAFILEADALQSLFVTIQQQKNNIAFKTNETEFQSFNRFITLDRIFQDTYPEQKELLKQKYVIVFLRQILNEPLRIDQVSILNTEISRLPNTALSRDFLSRLAKILPPDLAEMLNEKIEREFSL